MAGYVVLERNSFEMIDDGLGVIQLGGVEDVPNGAEKPQWMMLRKHPLASSLIVFVDKKYHFKIKGVEWAKVMLLAAILLY